MATKLPINSTRRNGLYDRTQACVMPSWVNCEPTFYALANHLAHWRRVAHGIPRSWTLAREEAARYLREVQRRMSVEMGRIVAEAV